MRQQMTPDRRLAALAARQHGVVAARQLELDDSAIARRVAAGRLHRVHRGVYAVGHTLLDRRGHYLAAVLACGPGAALSHRSAADLWGLRRADTARIDVTVPRETGRRSTSRIVVHRPVRPAAATVHEGIPVTTPGRTLADLATALPRRALERAAEQAEVLRLDVVVDPDHPGAGRLAAACGHDLSTTTRSPLEDVFLELCDAHGAPRPRVNSLVEGFEVDCCWPELRLVVETDGHGTHRTRAAFERDRARDARLTALGWRVVRFTERQVRLEPRVVAGLLWQLLSARSPSLATLGSPSP